MKIHTEGKINRLEEVHINLCYGFLKTTIPADLTEGEIPAYLEYLHIFDSGHLSFQLAPLEGSNYVTFKPEVFRNMCVVLRSEFDEIVCHQPRGFKDNALLGLWSSRREEGDPIEVLLIDQA